MRIRLEWIRLHLAMQSRRLRQNRCGLSTWHRTAVPLQSALRPEMIWTRLLPMMSLCFCQTHVDAAPLRTRLQPDERSPSMYIDDDIRITEVTPYESTISAVALRNAVKDKVKTWTKGIVPYVIDTTFFSNEQLKVIEAAMDEVQENTCIRFVRRKNELPYLFVSTLSRCWSEIGMPPDEGIRTLSLGEACTQQRGTVVHELLHILGFWHEHNRPDRDDYVTIKWENILEGYKHNFAKYSNQKVDTLDEPYDYNSIMHYSAFAFARNSLEATIQTNIPVVIGQRFALSPLDIRKINKLYNCSSLNMPVHSVEELGGAKLEDPSRLVFPAITELVPLPFRFNWSSSSLPSQSQLHTEEMIFPSL